jgi:hypothetical protein
VVESGQARTGGRGAAPTAPDTGERQHVTDSERKSTALELGLWVALLAAFSPTLTNLGSHWWEQAWPRYSLIFIPLLVWCVRCEQASEEPPRAWRRFGVSLLALSLLMQLVATSGAMPALGRPALALAIIGLLLFRGLTSARCALLALWIIPMPNLVSTRLAGVACANALYRAVGSLLSPLGLDLEIESEWIRSGTNELQIAPETGGLLMLSLILGLAWYRMLRTGNGVGSMIRDLVPMLLAGAAVQLAAVAAASITLVSGRADTAQAILDLAWLIPAVAVVAWTETGRRPAAGSSSLP